MADVITQFKLETTQFDSKLRDASKNISSLAKDVRGSAADFDKMAKANLTAAEALGKIATSGTTAKDRVMELVGAFNDAAKAYNKLTDEQKQSDFGKALSESLQTLKTRITEAKKELYSIGDAAKGGGLFGGKDFGGMLQVFGGNMMTKAASVVGDFVLSMKDMVAQGVEMAKQGEGIRIAFERLNQPGLLDNLNEATHNTISNLELMKAAVKFSDFKLPLEDLGTYLAFAQQKAKDTGESIDYLVSSIVTGLGRQSVQILDNLGISASEIRNRMKEGGDMTKVVADIIRENMRNVGEYVETASDKAAQANKEVTDAMAALGETLMPLQQAGVSLWHELEVGALNFLNNALKPVIEAFTTIGRMNKAYGMFGGGSAVGSQLSALAGSNNQRSDYFKQLGTYRATIQGLQKRIDAIQAWQGGDRSDAVRGIIEDTRNQFGSLNTAPLRAALDAQVKMMGEYKEKALQILNPVSEEITNPGSSDNNKKGGGGRTVPKPEEIIPAGSVADLTKQMSELRKEQNLVTDTESWKAYETEIKRVQMEIDILRGKVKLDASGMNGVSITEGISKKISAEREKIDRQATNMAGGIDFTELDKQIEDTVLKNRAEEQVKQAKKVQEAWKQAGAAVGMFGNVLGSLKDPAAQIGATVAQAIATVALAYADSLAKDEPSKKNIWAFIAASAAAMVSMATTISSIHSATGYASGGVVGGSHYSGDMEYARLNAGETVLTQAQTGIVASALQSGTSDLHLETDVRGDTLRLILRRGNMKRGYGSRSLVL